MPRLFLFCSLPPTTKSPAGRGNCQQGSGNVNMNLTWLSYQESCRADTRRSGLILRALIQVARYEILPEMLVPAVVEQAKKLGNLDESADD